MRQLLLTMLILSSLCYLQGQNNLTNEIIANQIERMAERDDDEADYTEEFENYMNILDSKININDIEELSQLVELNIINIFITEKINEYRNKYGDIIHINELKYIEGIDETTFQLLKPLIVFRKENEKKWYKKKKGTHKVIFLINQPFNKKAGYGDVNDSILAENPNKKYLGSPQKAQIRYNFDIRDKLEAGFVMEKDAGEYVFRAKASDTVQKLIKKSMYPTVDFVSCHFLLKDLKFVKTLALGDFQLAFGQGLTMGSGQSMTMAGTSLLRKNKKIRASKSANEARYLRGIATTLKHKEYELTLFYSNKKADANIVSTDSTGQTTEISALQYSGLHRTVGELIDRHSIRQQLLGLNICYKTHDMQIGYTFHKTFLSCELNPEPRIYNNFYFKGKSLANHGVDFYYVRSKLALFGEMAISDNLAPAVLTGAILQPAGYIDFSILYRYYDKGFQNFYCNAFSNSSSAKNEKGLLFSTSISFAPKWKLIATADLPQSDWMKSSVYSPSRIQEYNCQIQHQINKNSLFYIQLKYKAKETNHYDYNTYTKKNSKESKSVFRIHASYTIGDRITCRNRAEYHISDTEEEVPEHSYLIYQDISYHSIQRPYSFDFRYAVFDSPSGAVYTYESDVSNTFASTGFYHKGIRIYLVGKATIYNKLNINAKVGITIYSDVDEIGSGLEKIDGNIKSDATIQMILKL
ncbi:MAG: helix-hairpin-helix domain-containing protein [Candidatus Limimorpha sp.]